METGRSSDISGVDDEIVKSDHALKIKSLWEKCRENTNGADSCFKRAIEW